MGEAQRKRVNGIQPAPNLRLVPAGQHERTLDDGTTQRVFTFQVTDKDGNALVTDTVDGPQQVLIASVPITVGRSLIVLPTSRRG